MPSNPEINQSRLIRKLAGEWCLPIAERSALAALFRGHRHSASREMHTASCFAALQPKHLEMIVCGFTPDGGGVWCRAVLSR
jgi:hypothetical protein